MGHLSSFLPAEAFSPPLKLKRVKAKEGAFTVIGCECMLIGLLSYFFEKKRSTKNRKPACVRK